MKMEESEIGAVMKRFGDEQSTLLDRFERVSFEIQLNQAILGRSLSAPGVSRSAQIPSKAVGGGSRRRRGLLRIDRVLKKLLKPILGRKSSGVDAPSKVPNRKDPFSWKAVSRSVRL